MILCLVQIGIQKPEGFWPITVVGWITVAGFIGTAASLVYLVGRWSQKMETHKEEVKRTLDGFGARVGSVEHKIEHEEGRTDTLEVNVAATQGRYEALITLLGEAKGSVDHFRVGLQNSTDKIEKKIDGLREAQDDTKLELSQRLTAVETTLQLRHKS
jgi:chromosome segregation ATPase